MIKYFVSELGIFSDSHTYDPSKEPDQNYVDYVLSLEFNNDESLEAA